METLCDLAEMLKKIEKARGRSISRLPPSSSVNYVTVVIPQIRNGRMPQS